MVGLTPALSKGEGVKGERDVLEMDLKMLAQALAPKAAIKDFTICTNMDAQLIINAVTCVLCITEDQLKERCNKPELVDARHICVNMLKTRTLLTLKEIGRFIDRDHTTVISGLNTAKNLLFSNQAFREKWERVNEAL